MNHIIEIGNSQGLQDILKYSSLGIAILRCVFHVLTTSLFSFFFAVVNFPCIFEGNCGGGPEDFTPLLLALTFAYFLFDMTSLPQDIYYIWATTSPDVNLEDSNTQLIGFGLAIANVIWVIGSNGLISIQNYDFSTG